LLVLATFYSDEETDLYLGLLLREVDTGGSSMTFERGRCLSHQASG